MPFAPINDLQLYYEQQGQGDDLILIGGVTTNHLVWQEMMAALTQQYNVVRFDNRGAGKTKTPQRPFTLHDIADDVIGLMDYLNIKQANIVGHSMGGNILQLIMLKYPHRVKKALICGSSAKVPLTAMLHLSTISKLKAANVNPALIAETILPWIFGNAYLKDKNNIDDIIVGFQNDPYPQSEWGYNHQVLAIEQFDTRQQLSKITLETLVIAGEQDLIIPLYCGEFIHQQIKSSSMEVIKDVGHMFQFECPNKFSQLVIDFVG